ncbi:MAG: GDSL-type esterase/lipase family protein [Chitinophagaceae bacterium]
MVSGTYTLLALGDSYTIGEGVALFESFPYQTIQLLRKAGHNFNAPEIIAKTGWTTDDLKKGIRNTMFQTSYHYVSLMIGVNDQYTNKNINEYAANFEVLLKQSIVFAANNPSHVFVLSIPNWSNTPFAADRNRVQIANDIYAFNTVNEKISRQYKVRYLSIAEQHKDVTIDLNFLAPDLLHPSKKEYSRWADQLSEEIQKLLV